VNPDEEEQDSDQERDLNYGNDAKNGLSYFKMLAEIDRTHPRTNVEKKLSKMSVCGSRTGWFHCCWKAARRSDFDPFGPGIVVYF